MKEKQPKSKDGSGEKTPVAGIKTARSYPTFRKNPFLDTTTIKTRTKRLTVAKGSTIIDLNSGEIEGTTEVAQIFRVDEEQFIKIFTSQIRAFFELGQGAYKLLQIVFFIAQKSPRMDRIYMNPETLPEDLPGISNSAFYRALAELLEKGFLARVESDTHWYFINPSLFFNGDRVRFITEYHRTEREEAKAAQQARKQALLDWDNPPQI